MTWEETKKILLNMTRRSYEEALFAGTSGNLSVYDREKETMIITPSSIPYETMKEEDLVLMKLSGEIIEGRHRPSSEWRMHAAVYKEREDVGAVVHTHSPYATSFAVNREPIPIILIEMIPFLGGDMLVADFAMPGTEDVGREALKVLKGRNACLMSNHGVLAVGENLEQAHIRAIYAEDAAKIYSLAKSNGQVKEVPGEFVEIMKSRKKV
ncbi:MAG: class II aldolase/adducin family protein [Hungatella sp.]|nr:class II aldolase/adducin family protein [Hungatella sp.]